jgi:hypothetical protein
MGLCSNGYVISGKGKRRVYVKAPQNCEWVSILEAISASGQSIRPLVVFKGQNLQSSWFPDIDVPDWHYTTSENGWTSNKTGLQWLRNVFIPESRPDSSRTRLLVIDGHGSHVSIDFMWECRQNNIQLCFLPPHTSHILQPLDLGCFGPEKRRYREEIRKMASSGDTGMVHKLHFIQCYQKARTEGLSQRNIRSSWKAAGVVPWNPQKVLASSQIVGVPAAEAGTPTPTARKRARAPSPTELLQTTPKKPHDLYVAAQALENSDKLSRTLRTALRKSGKALSKMSVDLATAKAVNDSLQNQLDSLKTRGQRKRVTLDPNQTFADIDSVKKAQEAASLATTVRESKTKSDEALRVASEQAGSLRLEDMMFDFQV